MVWLMGVDGSMLTQSPLSNVVTTDVEADAQGHTSLVLSRRSGSFTTESGIMVGRHDRR
jgi:hypothetical protein